MFRTLTTGGTSSKCYRTILYKATQLHKAHQTQGAGARREKKNFSTHLKARLNYPFDINFLFQKKRQDKKKSEIYSGISIEMLCTSFF